MKPLCYLVFALTYGLKEELVGVYAHREDANNYADAYVGYLDSNYRGTRYVNEKGLVNHVFPGETPEVVVEEATEGPWRW